LSKDHSPQALDESNFYYLSDQRGIVNLFKFNKTTGIYSQVTNYASSIKDYDLNFGSNTLSMVMTKNLKENIFVDRGFNINRQVFTPATRRKDLQQARVIRDRRKQQQEEDKSMSIKDLLNSRLNESQPRRDTMTLMIDSVDVIKRDTIVTPTSEAPAKRDSLITRLTPGAKDIVNTDNYVFEDEAVKQNQPEESFLTRFMKAREKSRITGPFPYESKFSSNNLVTSLVVDPLRGLGISIETQMNDMLENYRFFGGLMTSVDLRNGDFYAEFQYLKSLIDFSARVDRKGIRWKAEPLEDGVQPNLYHYSLNRIEVSASLPL
jgi:hypothetical protein